MTQLVICQHIWRKSELPKSNDDLEDKSLGTHLGFLERLSL